MAIYKDVEPLEVFAWKSENEDFDEGVKFAFEKLDTLPTADVVEVRHGEWILEHEDYGKMMCSVCKAQSLIEIKPDPYEDYQLTEFYATSNYCHNCGARMDGGKEG